MTELRKDPIIDNWVIISTERGRRPLDYKIKTEEKRKSNCVFCEGNEDKTPPEIFSFREEGTSENTPGWKVRVVSNKYPALKMEDKKIVLKKDGMLSKMDGLGVHEVIIETPHHDKNIDNLTIDQIVLILKTYRQRYLDLSKDKRIKYILIFKNYGIDGGASLEHPHSQLIGTPIIPQRIKEELAGAKEYFNFTRRCIFCDYITQELKSKERLIKEAEEYVVISPFAARFPFETWILPKYHHACYEKASNSHILGLARIMKEILSKINKKLNNPPYNFIIHTAPSQEFSIRECSDLDKKYHWHIEIIPRLNKIAGFEWGSGFYINTISPEEATKILTNI
ncbi:MAG TPA: galactose-1-phosphate uridylyltransferase [Candidatus Atribacteria bacterium]|nr:galactose-1-phosphate uridylyltransferase [Candidatus Atribacteria bacterium]